MLLGPASGILAPVIHGAMLPIDWDDFVAVSHDSPVSSRSFGPIRQNHDALQPLED